MRISLISATTLAAMSFAAASSANEPGSWRCDEPAVLHPSVTQGIASISTKPSLGNVILEYMKRYDAKVMRSACQAFADGQSSNISCLNGRRDWSAIAASLPDDLIGLPALAQREHLLKIQAEGNGVTEAFEFCKSVGALRDDGFSLQIGDE